MYNHSIHCSLRATVARAVVLLADSSLATFAAATIVSELVPPDWHHLAGVWSFSIPFVPDPIDHTVNSGA